MATSFTARLKEWTHFHLSSSKIDFMSLNRLRQNLSIDSSITHLDSYTKKSKQANNHLIEKMKDGSLNFDNMEIVLNPYGHAPLVALALFHTKEPCNLSYTVNGENKYHHKNSKYSLDHTVPIVGLYPDKDNEVLLELFDESENLIDQKTINIKTSALSLKKNVFGKELHYPEIKDEAEVTRYRLSLPSDYEPVSIGGGRYLIISSSVKTPVNGELLPTLMYEVDLMGRVFRAFYVGTGIMKIFGKAKDSDNILIASGAKDGVASSALEIERKTGAVKKSPLSTKELSEMVCESITKEELDELAGSTPVQFTDSVINLSNTEYSSVGWLQSPTPYKGASISTSNAVGMDYLRDKYDMRFWYCEDTLLIQTKQNQMLELVFSKYDEVYQLDLTSNIQNEADDSELQSFILAVPLTEMHSGTYSVVIRFVDGGQEVLLDTLTLSRTRK